MMSTGEQIEATETEGLAAPTPDESTSASEDTAPGSGVSDDGESAETASDGESVDAGEDGGSRSRTRGSSVQQLEEEGDVAADYLEELLDIVDVDGDIDIDVENGRASLAIIAESGSDRSLRRLVGSNGEVLEALQELTRLAVQASTGERSRLMLDIAGHRAARRKVITEQAGRAIEEATAAGKPVTLDPMTAFERKIVHDVVAGAGLKSESEGADPGRYVVVIPAS